MFVEVAALIWIIWLSVYVECNFRSLLQREREEGTLDVCPVRADKKQRSRW
jgi:hypothetical protein